MMDETTDLIGELSDYSDDTNEEGNWELEAFVTYI